MSVGLTECRDNLGHLKPEDPVGVGKRCPMAALVAFMPLGRMRPNLDPLVGKRRTVARAANCADHPEAAAADTVHDRRTRPVIVGAASHRTRWLQAFREGWRNATNGDTGQHCATDRQQGTTGERGFGHEEFSYRSGACSAGPEMTGLRGTE